MRGHGKLLRGLTPQHSVDELLEQPPIVGPGQFVAVEWPQRGGKSSILERQNRLTLELRRTSLQLRVTAVVCVVEGLLLVVGAGLRLLGL